MDFSKFRQSGDLSDLVVEVNGVQHKLHKFPLYAKSEYFCKLARSPDVSKIDLPDFPGGPEIFGIVADFCYSMPINMTKNNIVQIRCAAEYLKMAGQGNLIETSEKFLKDTITSSKMSRSTPCISSLLLYCSAAGNTAHECGIVAQCFDALIDCWLKPPTKFSSPTNILKHGDRREDKTVIALLSLPLDWFVNMLVTAREKGVRVTLLAELATSYISIAVDREEADEKQTREKSADAGDTMSAGPVPKSLKSKSKTSKKQADISTILDNILLELPEESLHDNVVTIEWLTKVIRIATTNGCQCRRVLVKAAGELLTKLNAEDLCIISPSLLHNIVVESCNSENGQSEKACRIVDMYMSEMVRKGVLTAETFKLLAAVVPKDARSNHDQMYNILEYVLTAENEKLSSDQRQELINTVNFELLNEDTLQRAQKSTIVPPEYVAKGALALCVRLRGELETAKSTILKQEDEVKRLQSAVKRGKRSTPIMTSVHAMPSLGLKETSFSSSLGGREPELEFMEPTKDYNHSDDSHNSTTDVLNAVRNKLSVGTSNPSTSSPYNTFRPLQAVDQDMSYEEDMDYKYDKHFKSSDNSRSKNRQLSYGSYRPTYSSYSLRY